MHKEIQIDLVINEYEKLLQELKIDTKTSVKDTNQIIRKSLQEFCESHKNPAIWCLGKHTKMLMADFMNEMKNVKTIVDSSKNDFKNSGFRIITHDQIEQYNIDGIIISSYIYKEEIKKIISDHHKEIKYLDIYDKLRDNGIILKSSYFSMSHPYSKYQVINEMQIRYSNAILIEEKIKFLKKIIEGYLVIKDFYNAIRFTKTLAGLSEKDEDKELLKRLELLYLKQRELVSNIASENVLMLCIDGLRRKDLLSGKLPKLLKWVKDNTYFFEQAYSLSTSTYESLFPVYGSNCNMKDKFYEKRMLSEDECPFIKEACGQDRTIYFYTDSDQYVNCKKIIRRGYSQTITEKLWDFIGDASKEDNGLFYLHVLYESHFSYVNPYSEENLVADGSNIMFDFLDIKGGGLRTDYEKQQRDALMYIDNMLTPFLELFSGRIFLYADHGNILMKENETLQELERTKFAYHKDLIEIPMAIKCPELPERCDKRLISLMELNKIVCSLLRKKAYSYIQPAYIKVQRSRIYNPDFQYIYSRYGREKELQAFELFIFCDGIQLVVYENGDLEMAYEGVKTEVLERYQYIKNEITVCDNKYINMLEMKNH